MLTSEHGNCAPQREQHTISSFSSKIFHTPGFSTCETLLSVFYVIVERKRFFSTDRNRRKKSMSEQTTVGEEDGSHPVKTILIVEDDAEMGAFLIQALKDETPYQA